VGASLLWERACSRLFLSGASSLPQGSRLFAVPQYHRGMNTQRRLSALLLSLFCAVASLVGASGAHAGTTRASAEALNSFPQAPLVIESAGKRLPFDVWVAATPERREQGLMFVTALPEKTGMLFMFALPMDAAFWMKNTLLPLSIAWFDADGEFVSNSDMQPCPAGTRTCPTFGASGPYRTAIEVPLGGLESLGLVAGSRLVIGDECDQLSLAAPPAV